MLILDDVFAELDARRRSRLAGMVSDAEQVLVTAAVEEDVPSQLLEADSGLSLVRVSPGRAVLDPRGHDAVDGAADGTDSTDSDGAADGTDSTDGGGTDDDGSGGHAQGEQP